MPRKRQRTPHFIRGLGDGNIREKSAGARATTDDLFPTSRNRDRARSPMASTSRERGDNERLLRMEPPPVHNWNDFLSSQSGDGMEPQPITSDGPWQVSAFAMLATVVLLSAVFLHILSDSSERKSNYHRRSGSGRRKQNNNNGMFRKKKTDEWSEDELDLLSDGCAYRADNESSAQPTLYYPYQRLSQQQHRYRKISAGGNKEISPLPPPQQTTQPNSDYQRGNYYLNQAEGAVVPAYRSPSSSLKSRSSTSSHAKSTSASMPTPGMPTDPTQTSDHFSPVVKNLGHAGYRQPLPSPQPQNQFARRLSANVSSFGSTDISDPGIAHTATDRDKELDLGSHSPRINVADAYAEAGQGQSYAPEAFNSSTHHHSNFISSSHHRAQSNHGTSMDIHMDETPRIGHCKPQLKVELVDKTPLAGSSRRLGGESTLIVHRPDNRTYFDALNQPHASHTQAESRFHQVPPMPYDVSRTPVNQQNTPLQHPQAIPFIPLLDPRQGAANSPANATPAANMNPNGNDPPSSILVEELKLVQMESGSVPHWQVGKSEDKHRSQKSKQEKTSNLNQSQSLSHDSSSTEGSAVSSSPSPSPNDPRKSIIHKRKDLTAATDAASSLQSSIDFSELKLREVIGGGGFGQVWRATWRGTPVAVKVLTGSAQAKHVSKAILEEFAAEINLLRGMRHPNICLYMGACVDPPNRAIITELAANGSLWDALRLPLTPPFVCADGVSRQSWPLELYNPGSHGMPPSSTSHMPPNLPPRGSWPWILVKRVACGAARGMAYLHSGKPPILHRDLKSANILLDESYTAKVCDFGLSRLKAQERSMTGNCGTVQWMAPEVLANQSYNEKADVFSFGIICWELLSRECPYDGMNAIQCALAVLNRDHRPEIPNWCPQSLRALVKACFKKDPKQRPTFSQIILALDAIP